MKRAASPCLQRGEPRLGWGLLERGDWKVKQTSAVLFWLALERKNPEKSRLKFASMLQDFQYQAPCALARAKDTPNHIPTSTSLQAGLRLRPGWTWDPQSDGSPETLHATLNTEEPQVPPRPPLQPDLRLPVSRRHPSHLASRTDHDGTRYDTRQPASIAPRARESAWARRVASTRRP